jgi:hypothetical protein
MRLCLIVTVAWPGLQFFPHYLINGMKKKKKKITEHKTFSLRLLSETFLILRRIGRDMIKNVYWSLCKVPLLLSDFIET